jgi:RNA polymerase sigma-70 factor (ECF subfamily)
MAKPEIIELARRAIGGDKVAFEELCEAKQKEIVFTAYSMLGNYQDAEDAAQESIISMFRHIGKLKSPDAIDAWIFRIVKSKCHVILKKRTGRKDEIDVDDDAVFVEEDDKEFLPGAVLQDKVLCDMIYEIILRLPEKRREVILMYYYDEMSYKEIAYATGKSMKTVSANISKARVMIKNELESNKIFGAAVGGTVGSGGLGGSDAVLQQILKQQADARISSEDLAGFESRWKDSISSMKMTTAKPKWFVTGVACVLAVVAVFAGIVYLTGGFTPTSAPAPDAGPTAADIILDREIEFAGGDTTDGHLNPGSAVLANLKDGDIVKSWEIIEVETEKVINSGGSDGEGEATEAISELIAKNQKGVYTLQFKLNDKAGNHITLHRVFEIGERATYIPD